jgi:recombinational DNA repair ATPase RecF
MRLTKITISNYRRMEGPCELRVLGPVTAVVGPNEAGKTSLLEAIAHLSADKGFTRREFYGRSVRAATQASFERTSRSTGKTSTRLALSDSSLPMLESRSR